MQRILPATVLTLALHGVFLSWRLQLPEKVQPKPLARKISVTLQRLSPPPPLKKIIQKVPALPKIAQVQYQPVRPLQLKPGKKIAAVLPPLPKLDPVTRKAIKPLTLQPVPVKKTQPKKVHAAVRSNPNPQPIQQVRPVTKTPKTRPVISRQQPVSTPVVRKAAPLYKTNPPPEYPSLAKKREIEGVVILEARIDVHGKVADLRIFSGSGHKILDKAALKAVRRWRFSPGTVGGKAQAMWVKVPVRFALR
ncbi:MAG: energy transducer TonB [Candidatus Electrothrix sp. ATG1]|nr:energy transducer TonB [Candidatus Electrothrix sp. ATG1]